jgi:hypothetical protein
MIHAAALLAPIGIVIMTQALLRAGINRWMALLFMLGLIFYGAGLRAFAVLQGRRKKETVTKFKHRPRDRDQRKRRAERRKTRKKAADRIERQYLDWMRSWPPYSYERVRGETGRGR